jgi:phosphoribosylamine---glycine ligase
LKILVLGGGGREHALVWKLAQSSLVEKIWCAPGNGGISQVCECLPVDLSDVHACADLAKKLGVDITVVGPELPLVRGVADEFGKRGLLILGPSKRGAQLEGSKIFAKEFMQRHSIPTAAVYGIFNSPIDAYAELCAVDWPLVIKADGLCAGKGVLVTSSPDEATSFIDRLMEKKEFGDAGASILLEEGLTGRELSYIILTDGTDFVAMAPTRDYKRLCDNDEGPNTGGMGAYSTDDILSPQLETEIIRTVVEPTLAGLRAEGITYRGFMYFGLMVTDDGPTLLEFNCRLGDPETEVIVLRADFDLAEVCRAAAADSVRDLHLKWSPACAACVVLSTSGYPLKPQLGDEVFGFRRPVASDTVIFHAGTRSVDSHYYTSGGRVAMVAARGSELRIVREQIYDLISSIRLAGGHYRTDIGRQGAESAAGGTT